MAGKTPGVGVARRDGRGTGGHRHRARRNGLRGTTEGTLRRGFVVGGGLCLVLGGLLAMSSAWAGQAVILSTTTSTQDSGLLDVLVPMFEKKAGLTVKVISVGTGQALALAARGEADVCLVHAPDSEKKYVADGLLLNRRLVMHNDFIIVGPAADPARIKGLASAADALKRIAEAKATFVSRGDNSGTHQLEKKLWKEAKLEPAS